MTNSSYFVSTVAQGLWTWKQSLVACLGIGVCMWVHMLVCFCPCDFPCSIYIRAAGCVSLGGSMAPLCTSPSMWDFARCWPAFISDCGFSVWHTALAQWTWTWPELRAGTYLQEPAGSHEGRVGVSWYTVCGDQAREWSWPVLLAAEIIRNMSRFMSTNVYCSVIDKLKALETMLGFQQLSHDSICKTTCIGWSSSTIF